MMVIVFNVIVMVGELVGVWFIVYVGFFLNLVKYVVFIVQIFGVEKVFFRVFKFRWDIFKYGFIYYVLFVGQISFKYKGKIF